MNRAGLRLVGAPGQTEIVGPPMFMYIMHSTYFHGSDQAWKWK